MDAHPELASTANGAAANGAAANGGRGQALRRACSSFKCAAAGQGHAAALDVASSLGLVYDACLAVRLPPAAPLRGPHRGAAANAPGLRGWT